MGNFFQKILISYLSKETNDYVTPQKSDFEKIMNIIKPGDVLLVEGKQRFSKAIKYLTKFINSNTNKGPYLVLLADLYRISKKYNNAIKLFFVIRVVFVIKWYGISACCI